MLFHDRDTKFTKAVDQELTLAGIKVQKTAFRAPNTNAFVERFVQSVQQECLDHFLVMCERHLNYLCSVFVDYYHRQRPHQGMENELLMAASRRQRRKRAPPDTIPLSEVRCEQRLGGLLKHYYRKAA